MVRALSARARDIAWRLQQRAYVENLVPRSGVEFLRGADQPIAPSCTRSQTATPWPTRMSNARVLLVANHTVSNRPLVEAVRLRAAVPPVAFHLVVPGTPHGFHRVVDPEVADIDTARERLRAALPILSDAAGQEVTGTVRDADPLAAVRTL